MLSREKPVLETKCIGMQPHYSGHPLAPMEYVYECKEPPKEKRRMRTPLWARIVGPASVLYLAYVFVNGVIYTIGQFN